MFSNNVESIPYFDELFHKVIYVLAQSVP